VLLGAGAVYVRTHRLRIGLGLPVRHQPQPTPTALSVAVVAGTDLHLGAAAVVGRLAELATCDELIVIHGADPPPRPDHRNNNVLLDGPRYRLPRHRIVAVPITAGGGALEFAAPLRQCVRSGP